VLLLYARFHEWLNAPESPKTLKPVATEKPEKIETIPPFDIQEIPDAMRKLKMPTSAKLMEKWFAGKLNYSPRDADERAEINQNGMRYPSDMYDTTTITLDWVLRFSRARKQFDRLTKDAIRSPAARKILIEKLKAYANKVVDFSTAEICGNDIASLHEQFHFQHISVDGEFSQKLKLMLATSWEHSGAPDDLTGALGSFNFYAAIGSALFSYDPMSRKSTVEIRGIWVYIKDNYTFTDRQDERSQYLGHWSRNGVITIPLDFVAATSRYIPYTESPVTIGDPTIKGNVHYPIHNSDFRQWAIRHQRGGDFIIYSDRRFVRVVPGIKLHL